jgi:hypothetical protein
MKRWKLLGVAFGLVSVVSASALSVGTRRETAQQPKPGKVMPTRGATMLVELGLKDSETTGWEGEIRVSEGSVIALRVVGGGMETVDGAKWKARSQVAKKKQAVVNPVRLRTTIDAPLTASVTIETSHGGFSFKLADLATGKPAEFFDGQARVTRGPVSLPITDAPADDDFPATVVAPDGTVWLTYVSYDHGNSIRLPTDGSIPDDWSSLVTKGNGDQVKLMRFDGSRWSDPIDVTDAKLDVWRPAVAVDGSGRVWVVWSQNMEGNWEILARSYDPRAGEWSAVERVTTEHGADINVVAATSRSGTVWLAWMRWEGTDFAIRAQSLGGNRAARRTRNFGGSNEWSPSIATDANGKVYIAFDTYSAGNYDVYLWMLDENVSGPQGETIPIATSPRFEARPSVTVDRQNRVWVAYEDADPNWGKDFGSRWKGKSGVPFYVRRNIAVRCFDNGRLLQAPPVESEQVDTDMLVGKGAEGKDLRLSFPRLATDTAGRVWLAFRRHASVNGAGERWASFATAFDGRKWLPELPLPNSENLMDNRPALAALKSGGLLAVYSSDGRTAGTNTAGENNLHAALLTADGDTTPPELAAALAAGDGKPADPVHPNESEDVKRIREFRVEVGGKTYQFLRGEFHRHTEISAHRDQDGPFEELWRYGLDVARMDWLGPGDHDNGVGPTGATLEYTWWLTQKQIDMYHHAPTFMPMFTYERSVVYPSGHRNVIFARRGIRPLPRLAGQDLLMGTAEAGSPDIKRFFAYLKHFDGICSSHTSATNMGTDWRDNDPAVEPVVEIYQGHRQNYEHKDAPQSAADEADSIGGYQPAGYVWNALQRGYRLGFQISSDHVSTHLSYAIVLAESPTRAGIVDAFKRRHSYGAQDNIILVVKCGDHLMGDEFTLRSPPQLEITAIGTAPISRVSVVRGVGNEVPTYVYNATPNAAEVSLKWTDSNPVPGQTSYYYVRIEQSDGKLAWASPMWIKYEGKQ